MSSLNGIGSAQPYTGIQDALSSANAGRTADARAGSLLSTAPATTSVSAAAKMLASVLPASDVRMDRVAALQTSILAGTYSVPASGVAAKMLSALLD